MITSADKTSARWLAFGSLGVVFGDIGTSPIYTFRQCVSGHQDAAHILGAASLIIWYLMAVVSLKYVHYLMQLTNQGEGGVFALLALVKAKAGHQKWLIYVLIGGAALLYGDGIITPAISVLSAVEGLAPPTLADNTVNPDAWGNPWIAAAILAALFFFQKFGTNAISKAFAPVMLTWFIALAVMGVGPILQAPAVLEALNPGVGIAFLTRHIGEAMAMLAGVTLAITGAEALYADLGHFGKPAISSAWSYVVAPCLILNYLGQGAHLLSTPQDQGNPFFSLVPASWQFPLTLLSIAATVIASQALISGAYSLTRQAVNLGYCPRSTVKHTSAEREGQVYLPGVNLLLAIGSIGLVLLFKRSDNLAAAYGLAVTSTMVTTTIAYAVITYGMTRKFPLISIFLILIDLSLLIPNGTKFLTGGYIPVSIGLVISFVFIAWSHTRQMIKTQLASRVMPLEEFAQHTKKTPRVRNTAVVLCASPKIAPCSLMHWLKISQVLHEEVIVLSLVMTSTPRVANKDRLRVVEHDRNLFGVEADFGFMEELDIARLEPDLRKIVKAPETRTLYYILGRENLEVTSKWNIAARAYRYLNGTSRPITEALHIPPGQVIEVGTTIRI